MSGIETVTSAIPTLKDRIVSLIKHPLKTGFYAELALVLFDAANAAKLHISNDENKDLLKKIEPSPAPITQLNDLIGVIGREKSGSKTLDVNAWIGGSAKDFFKKALEFVGLDPSIIPDFDTIPSAKFNEFKDAYLGYLERKSTKHLYRQLVQGIYSNEYIIIEESGVLKVKELDTRSGNIIDVPGIDLSTLNKSILKEIMLEISLSGRGFVEFVKNGKGVGLDTPDNNKVFTPDEIEKHILAKYGLPNLPSEQDIVKNDEMMIEEKNFLISRVRDANFFTPADIANSIPQLQTEFRSLTRIGTVSLSQLQHEITRGGNDPISRVLKDPLGEISKYSSETEKMILIIGAIYMLFFSSDAGKLRDYTFKGLLAVVGLNVGAKIFSEGEKSIGGYFGDLVDGGYDLFYKVTGEKSKYNELLSTIGFSSPEEKLLLMITADKDIGELDLASRFDYIGGRYKLKAGKDVGSIFSTEEIAFLDKIEARAKKAGKRLVWRDAVQDILEKVLKDMHAKVELRLTPPVAPRWTIFTWIDEENEKYKSVHGAHRNTKLSPLIVETLINPLLPAEKKVAE